MPLAEWYLFPFTSSRQTDITLATCSRGNITQIPEPFAQPILCNLLIDLILFASNMMIGGGLLFEPVKCNFESLRILRSRLHALLGF